MKDDRSRPTKQETASQPNIIFEAAAFTSLMVAVLSLFLFAWIGDGVAHDRTAGFDLAIRNQVHAYASPPLTRAMIFISFLGGDGLTAAAILSVIAFLALHWRRAALWMVVTILGAVVLDLSLKYAFHRPRPVPFFVPVPYTYSFPSGHSLFSFCFYGVLAGLLTRRIRIPDGTRLDLDAGCSSGCGHWPVTDLPGGALSQRRVRRIPGRVALGEHAGGARSGADTAEGCTRHWGLAGFRLSQNTLWIQPNIVGQRSRRDAR